jgi:uncharacterized protein (DUF302 family)
MTTYTFAVRSDSGFDDVVARVTAALGDEGFGVLTTIDVRATMKEKLDVDYPPYRILGACNPPLAHQALTADPSIGALLPCNVVVRDAGDDVVVEFMDPMAVLGLVGHPDVAELASEVRSRLERVAASVERRGDA